jgi:hypothetical protein
MGWIHALLKAMPKAVFKAVFKADTETHRLQGRS